MKKILLLLAAVALFTLAAQAGPDEDRLKKLEAEIARLEKECSPAVGSTRAAVADRFGRGVPVKDERLFGFREVADEQSPIRKYVFQGETLIVRFDQDRVQSAWFLDPSMVYNPAEPQPVSDQLREREQWLQHLGGVRDKLSGVPSKQPAAPRRDGDDT